MASDWEDVSDGWEDVDTPAKTKKQEKKSTPMDKVLGAGQAGLGLLAPLPSQIAGGLYGLGTLLSGKGIDKANQNMQDTMEWNFGMGAFKPSTNKGKEYSENVQEIFNYPIEKAGDLGGAVGKKMGNEALGRLYGELPMATLMNFLPVGGIYGAGKAMTKPKKPAPPTMDVSKIEAPKPIEQPKPPISDMAQMELPDAGMIQAPQYGVMQGMSRVDENGMPIKADVSMEAQNLQNPLQRNLWGDELGPALDQDLSITDSIDKMLETGRNAQGQKIGKNTLPNMFRDLESTPELRQAADNADNVLAPREGPFVIPRSQRGAINMEVFSPEFKAQKQLDNGVRLFMQGGKKPVIIAIAQDGTRVGEVAFGHDNLYGSAKETGNLEADWVTTDPNKMSNSPDASRLGETTKSEYPGLATEMYKFAAEQGNDITRSFAQTAEGKAMWDRWEQKGVAFGGKIPKSQRGAIDLGPTQTTDKLQAGTKPAKQDTKMAPTSLPTIEAKDSTRQKMVAAGFEGTPYEIVNTLEEAKFNPGKDLSNNPVRDYVASGVEGQIRRNASNKLLKYTRTLFSNARNSAEQFSVQFVTGKNGINRLYRDLDANEWDQVVQVLQQADKARVDLTPDTLRAAGANEKQINLINRINEAMSNMYALGNAALMEQGFKPFKERTGYIPAMFSGAYTGLVRVGDKTVGIAQADTSRGYKKSVEYYKTKHPDATFVELPRKGLNTSAGYSRVFDGFNDIVSQIAKNDPDFADIKRAADFHTAESNKKLYNFDVHEKIKTGVEGALGDRPWLDRKQNSKEFLEGLINYLEEGSRYYSYQGALNKAGEMVADPELRASHPNTLKYIDRYSKHVSGRNIGPIGAAANWLIDLPAKAAGIGPGVPTKVLNEVRYINSVHMMGLYNPAFFAMQLTQYASGGLPEAAAIRQATGLSGSELGAAITSSALHTTTLATEMATGMKANHVPTHMRNAYQWMQDNGMLTFSEAELAHEVLQTQTERTAKKVASAPIEYGEKFTRPPVFMMYVDLFHRAGLKGDRLHQTAKNATDYSMANYHPDERPMLYSSLGYSGQFLGALTTYKHNLLEQYFSRTQNSAKQPAAMATMLGAAYAMYGISGLPGYQEADQIVQYLTGGKTIRELTFDMMPDKSLWDGVLSAKSGIDYNARLSMASVIPDDLGKSLAGPHISNSYNILSKAYKYAKDQDQASWNEFMLAATPSGARGLTEDALQVDKQGFVLNKEGQRKYSEPRDDAERDVRKWTALRPLRERLEDEDVYADRNANKAVKDKLREQGDRISKAINLNDEAGFKSAIEEYIKLGGDPANIQVLIKNAITQQSMTARERAQGGVAPKPSVGSIRQWEEFND